MEVEWVHSSLRRDCEMLPSFKLGDAGAMAKNYAGQTAFFQWVDRVGHTAN
jgi:hypothetical protein